MKPIKERRQLFLFVEPGGKKPTRGTEQAAAWDLYARILDGSSAFTVIHPGESALILLGIRTELPPGFKALVFIRSGTSLHRSLSLTNGVAVVDPDFRGEWALPFFNRSKEPVTISHGDRIAQFTLEEIHEFTFSEVLRPQDLSETKRGEGGFGHTGSR